MAARLSFRLWSRACQDDRDDWPRCRQLRREWRPRWLRSRRCPRRAISPRRKGKTPPQAGGPWRGFSLGYWSGDRWRDGLSRMRGAGRFRDLFVARRASASSGRRQAQAARAAGPVLAAWAVTATTYSTVLAILGLAFSGLTAWSVGRHRRQSRNYSGRDLECTVERESSGVSVRALVLDAGGHGHPR